MADPTPARHPPVVTIAALYGAGGSRIAASVAERLGVPFLDRAIPPAVARRAGLAEQALGELDERPRTRSQRLVASLARAAPTGEHVPDYADEEGVEPERETETFAAVVLELDAARWAGTRFVLRAGKALARR